MFAPKRADLIIVNGVDRSTRVWSLEYAYSDIFIGVDRRDAGDPIGQRRQARGDRASGRGGLAR
jgi:hypothetical protein